MHAMAPWGVAAGFALVFGHGLFRSLGKLGLGDWDYHRAWALFARRTLLQYGQWPAWNPHHCGGTASASNPSARMYTPSVFLTYVMGDDLGIRVWPLVMLALGFEGARRLAVRLGAGQKGSLLAALLVAGNGGVALHLSHGHLPQLPCLLLPWWLLGIHMSWTKPFRGALLGGAFGALACMEGGLYPLAYASLLAAAWSIREAWRERNVRPLLRSASVAAATAGMAAVGLFPMASELGAALNTPAPERIPLRALPHMLLGIHQGAFDANPVGGLPWAWHEYGTYVGALGLAALVWGIVHGKDRREQAFWLAAALVFLAIALGDFAPWAPWSVLHHLPFFDKMRASGRALQVTLLCSVIAAAPGFDVRPRLAAAVLLFLGLDLARIAASNLGRAFVVPEPGVHLDRNAGATLPGGSHVFRQILDRRHRESMTTRWFSTMTADVRANLGILDCYDRVVPVHRGAVQLWPQRDEVLVFPQDGQAEITRWSPNEIRIRVANLRQASLLVVNQNYHAGWESPDRPVVNASDTLAVEVRPGDTEIVLRFDWGLPWIGLGVGVVTALALALGVKREMHGPEKQPRIRAA